MNHKSVVFVIRMSAIGDVVVAARNIQYLTSNNYEPIFVSSIHMKEILLKIKSLKHFICFDDTYNPIYFLDGCEVSQKQFGENFDFFQQNNISVSSIFCDLQNTVRSKRAIHKLRVLFFKNKKIIVNKVKKNFLYRFLLILCARFNWKQNQTYSDKKIVRVHDLQLNTINSILHRDNRPTVEHSSAIYLRKDVPPTSKKYICLFLGASGKLKIWPKHYFKNLLELILTKTSYDIYLCGGKTEEDIGHYLYESVSELSNLNVHDRLHNVVHLHSLGKSLNLIAHAVYVVCNDSFASHVADAYQVPATVIFGPTSPKFGFVPLSDKITLKYKHLNCSPCSRHGKGKCRYDNRKCLNDINPLEIFKDFISSI